MIQVMIIHQDENIVGLTCEGHAHFDQYGKDLVCAAVSAILTGGFNAFQEDEVESILLEEGKAMVRIKNVTRAKIILETILTQLETIENAYPKNLKIKR